MWSTQREREESRFFTLSTIEYPHGGGTPKSMSVMARNIIIAKHAVCVE